MTTEAANLIRCGVSTAPALPRQLASVIPWRTQTDRLPITR